jgi:hypothetical protein
LTFTGLLYPKGQRKSKSAKVKQSQRMPIFSNKSRLALIFLKKSRFFTKAIDNKKGKWYNGVVPIA